MRELVERAVDAQGVTARAPAGRERSVTVNLRESPLAWLGARGLLTARQLKRASGCAPITSARCWRRG